MGSRPSNGLEMNRFRRRRNSMFSGGPEPTTFLCSPRYKDTTGVKSERHWRYKKIVKSKRAGETFGGCLEGLQPFFGRLATARNELLSGNVGQSPPARWRAVRWPSWRLAL